MPSLRDTRFGSDHGSHPPRVQPQRRILRKSAPNHQPQAMSQTSSTGSFRLQPPMQTPPSAKRTGPPASTTLRCNQTSLRQPCKAKVTPKAKSCETSIPPALDPTVRGPAREGSSGDGPGMWASHGTEWDLTADGMHRML